MTAKIVFDNGKTLTLQEDGEVVGSDRRIRGAVRFSRRGHKVDVYFAREVTARPDTIPWRFKYGTQRTKLFDDAGFLGGSYIVVRDEAAPNRPSLG